MSRASLRSAIARTVMDTFLPTARLGWTGMELTRVGFGAWAIGGGGWAFGWGSQDDAESVTAIRAAVESGVNWIDTAAVYGLSNHDIWQLEEAGGTGGEGSVGGAERRT